MTTFPPDERGRAVGAWTAWGGIGTVLGPLIGGQLVDTASWRWIFAINVPIVLITLFLVLRVVPEGEPRAGAKVDVVGAAPVRARPGWHHLRPDRAAAARLGRPGGCGAADRGRAPVRELRGLGGAQRPPDASARAVPAAQLRRRQHRDVLDVRRAGPAVLLPRPVPAAGGGLLGARGGHHHDPGHARDVPVLGALRRAGRPQRAALLHGRGPARGGRGARALPARGRRRRLPDRPAARRC